MFSSMKNHYRKRIGSKVRVSSSMKNHYWDGIGCRGRISSNVKKHYREGIGCKGRVSSSTKNHCWEGSKESVAEESLYGRNWVQRKNFLFYEESLLVCHEGFIFLPCNN
jgi:hypothetical protein